MSKWVQFFVDLPFNGRELVDDFSENLGNELLKVTISVTYIDFPGEWRFTVRVVMFNITVMGFCDLSNLCGPVDCKMKAMRITV